MHRFVCAENFLNIPTLFCKGKKTSTNRKAICARHAKYFRLQAKKTLTNRTVICVRHAKYFWMQKKEGPTGIWTRIAGFKVQSDNHYTIGPYHIPGGIRTRNLKIRSLTPYPLGHGDIYYYIG
jgi:hypothetical protein